MHIEKALGSFLLYHLDVALPGRNIALELIRRRSQRQKALSHAPARD